MSKIIILLIAGAIAFNVEATAQFKTKNLIIITIDGLRWQEVFEGADSLLFYHKGYVANIKDFEKKYWNVSPTIRRELLMPFLWQSVAKNGQIYGNRKLGSYVNIANPYRFSYPGYSEMLCGFVDENVNTNSLGPNPHATMFENLNKLKEFNGKIAVFSSWETFNDIYNEKRSKILVNAGFEPLTGKEFGPKTAMLNEMQTQLPDLFNGIRLDAATFQQGFEYLKVKKPRVLHLAFDETDDFGHASKYDLYLNTARYTDDFIRKIWEWVQSTPEYKDKTTLMITTDHGRGVDPEGWKSHGSKFPQSDETWFAIIGPDTPVKGETIQGQFYNTQFAKTLAKLLGYDYTNNRPVGEVIPTVMGR